MTSEVKQRVLLVEDESAIAYVLTEALNDEGYAVLVATTASEALRMAQQCQLSLVIFDYRLPDGDGVDFYRRLVSVAGPIPGILCSGDRDAAALAERVGVAVLEKPFDLDELIRVV